jgi:type VI protein secretion system component Hcp
MSACKLPAVLLLCLAVSAVAYAQDTAQTRTENFEQTPLQNWELQGAQITQQGQMGNVLSFQQHGFAGWAVMPGPSFTLQMSMMVQPESMFGVAFLASGEPPNQSEYQLLHEGGQFHLLKITNGQEAVLGNGPGLQPSTWTQIALQVNSGQIVVMAGNQQVLSATDRQPLTQGGLGFHGSGAAIDNLTLTGAGGGMVPMQPVEVQPIPMSGGEPQQPGLPPGEQTAQPQAQPTGQPAEPTFQPPQPTGQQPSTMQQMPGLPGQPQPAGQQTPFTPPTGASPGAMSTMSQPLQTTPFSVFLKLPDLPDGITPAQGKEKWIELFDWSLALSGTASWNWGALPSVTVVPPGTAGPLVVYKPFDRSSTEIVRRWAESEFMSEAILEVNTDAGGSNLTKILEIKLKNVRILSVTRHVASIWGPGVEEVELTFGELEWNQQQMQSGGTPAGSGETCSFRVSTGGALVRSQQ